MISGLTFRKSEYKDLCSKYFLPDFQQVSNFVFYAQSTITDISGRYTFCQYTIIVKNVHVKTYVYSDLFIFKQT